MTPLLSDLIYLLQEEFEPKKSFFVSPSQIHLKQEGKKKPLPIKVAQPPISTPPLEKKTPILKEEKIEAPPPPVIASVDHLSLSVKKLFPGFAIRDSIPKESDLDQTHRKILGAQVVLFSFREGKETDLFLQSIQQAITSHFAPAGVLDVKKWENKESLELFFKQSKADVVIAPMSLYTNASMLPYLKEIPNTGERFLGSSRLLLLKPFHQYFEQPSLKKELWHHLCAMLRTLKNTQASS